MQTILGLVSLLWLVSALVHGVLGTRVILRPVLASPLGHTAKGTSEVAWHGITWQFLVMSGAGFFALWSGEHQRLFALASIATAAGFAALFLVVGVRRFGNVWNLPQWILFAPVVGLSAASLNLDAFRGLPLGELSRPIAAVILVALALCHVAWALGSSFPSRSREELNLLVVGEPRRGSRMPGTTATWIVALLLLAAAACVLGLGARDSSSPWASLARLSYPILIGVFLLRGLGGFFEPAFRPAIRGTPYMIWSRRLYSPLALLLALLIGVSIVA